MKKPALPVGMCPIVAQEAKSKREKQQKHHDPKVNAIPGLLVMPTNSTSNSSSQKKKQSAVKNQNGLSNATTVPATSSSAKKSKSKSSANAHVASTAPASTIENKLCDGISELSVTNADDEHAKKIKKLRKKIREIETIEAKIANNELKKPDPDQMEKVGRKHEILAELLELEQNEWNESAHAQLN